MRSLTLVIFLASFGAAFAEDKEPKVRAKEPTVVTVYGTKENVETDKTREQPRSVGGKIVHGIARGIAGFTGWIMNTDEDIPREQDRAREEQKSKRER